MEFLDERSDLHHNNTELESSYLSFRPTPQPTRNPLNIVTRRPPSERSRHLLKRPTGQGRLRPLQARLKGTDLEAPRIDVSGNIEFPGFRKGRLGGLRGDGTGVESFGTLAGGRGGILVSSAWEGRFALCGWVGRHGGGSCDQDQGSKRGGKRRSKRLSQWEWISSTSDKTEGPTGETARLVKIGRRSFGELLARHPSRPIHTHTNNNSRWRGKQGTTANNYS